MPQKLLFGQGFQHILCSISTNASVEKELGPERMPAMPLAWVLIAVPKDKFAKMRGGTSMQCKTALISGPEQAMTAPVNNMREGAGNVEQEAHVNSRLPGD